MTAYYNENEPYAAQWLRNLIAADLIAPGEVDERDIRDVRPEDVRGYTQCHWFAGIAVWSYALRRAGWPDDRPVWTGSLPCQPFSIAGKRAGTADRRYLWPEMFRFVRECRPITVFGEQVASPDGRAWLDAVSADLEGVGYRIGSVDTCAAGFGAPQIRQRLWWVADANGRHAGAEGLQRGWQHGQQQADSSIAGGMAHSIGERQGGRSLRVGVPPGAPAHQPAGTGRVGGLADESRREAEGRASHGGVGAVAGFWSSADWLPCRDGKARPVEPIAQQMVDGSTKSLGRVCPHLSAQAEAEIIYACGSEERAREAMRNLWEAIAEEAQQERPPGRLRGVHEAPVLLAFLRQLSDQGWALAESIPCAGPEEATALLRVVRSGNATPRPSSKRELAGQPPREHPNALRLLSSILARYAQKAWGETFDANARATHPLAYTAGNRVGRLRGYGNALCAPAAEAFVRAYMEATGEG